MDPELFQKLPLVFFDLETTGLQQRVDEIVQICAIVVYPNALQTSKTFVAYCRPRCNKNLKGLRPSLPGQKSTAYDFHKIHYTQVEACKTWKSVGADFATFVTECTSQADQIVLVAYNGWCFDGNFIASNNSMHKLPGFPKKVYVCDPMRVAKQVFKGMKSFTQLSVYKKMFDISFANAHDAVADVEALVEICQDARFRQRMFQFCKRFPTLEQPKLEQRIREMNVKRRALPEPAVQRTAKRLACIKCVCGVVYSSFFIHTCTT